MFKIVAQRWVIMMLAALSMVVWIRTGNAFAADDGTPKGPPPVPVRVAQVEMRQVSDQISLVGTTQAIAASTIASEVAGVVERFPVKEGQFVRRGDLLVQLRDRELKLRLKATIAAREQTRANLASAKKELKRVSKLKEANSVADKLYDETFYSYRALEQGVAQSEAEIEYLKYQIEQKLVYAPFDGFVSQEHTQIGEWIQAGGPVVTLLDLNRIRITVDVPERYAVMLAPRGDVSIVVRSVSEQPVAGNIATMLPQGDANARTFPIRIELENPGFKIKSGMEARVRFNLATQREALLVPKDAVVPAGSNRLVFKLAGDQVFPVMVDVRGYHENFAAVEGDLSAEDRVVIRGNERLRPGQTVQIVP